MVVKQEREAEFYLKAEDQSVICMLCPQTCRLEVGERGICRGRRNIGGKLVAVNYGLCTGIALDPIEKKPLYHFHPGSLIVSLGPNSCNLSCFFCQNFGISQTDHPTRYISPGDLAEVVAGNCPPNRKQVAFTYTEPLTWFEYITDFADQAPDTDIVLVTNGFVNPKPLEALLPRVKAMNIDLKAMDDEFYRQSCGGSVEPVLRTIETAWKAGVHVEVTNLLIPGLNDSRSQIQKLVDYLAELDAHIPLHFSAYHPDYKASIGPTPVSTVLMACEMASQRIKHVYAGNVPGKGFGETLCPNCHRIVIDAGRRVRGLDGSGRCAGCGTDIYGRFGA